MFYSHTALLIATVHAIPFMVHHKNHNDRDANDYNTAIHIKLTISEKEISAENSEVVTGSVIVTTVSQTTRFTQASVPTNTNQPEHAASDSPSSKAANTTTTSSTASADAPISIDDYKAAVEALQGTFDANQGKAYIGSLKDADISTKREAAMFLAQIWHESGALKYKEEIACTGKDCNGSYPSSPEGGGKPGKSYHGRGYIQLTWDYNYKAASKALLGSESMLLENPEKVLEEELAWRTAAWYWKTHVHIVPDVVVGKFGASTKAINGALECSGSNKDKAVKRFDFYVKILKAYKINESPIESGCY